MQLAGAYISFKVPRIVVKAHFMSNQDLIVQALQNPVCRGEITMIVTFSISLIKTHFELEIIEI